MLVTYGPPEVCVATSVDPLMSAMPLLLKARTSSQWPSPLDQVNTSGRETEGGLLTVQLTWKEPFEDDKRTEGETVTSSTRSGEEEGPDMITYLSYTLLYHSCSMSRVLLMMYSQGHTQMGPEVLWLGYRCKTLCLSC